jgi:hypothetical protein
LLHLLHLPLDSFYQDYGRVQFRPSLEHDLDLVLFLDFDHVGTSVVDVLGHDGWFKPENQRDEFLEWKKQRRGLMLVGFLP